MSLEAIMEDILEKIRRTEKGEEIRKLYRIIMQDSESLGEKRNLIHVTHFSNIESILEHGLMPRRKLEARKIDFSPTYSITFYPDAVCLYYTYGEMYDYLRGIDYGEGKGEVAVLVDPTIMSHEAFINLTGDGRERRGDILDDEVIYKGVIPPSYILHIVYDPEGVKFEDVLIVAKRFGKGIINARVQLRRENKIYESAVYAWMPGCVEENLSSYANVSQFILRFYNELKSAYPLIEEVIDKKKVMEECCRDIDRLDDPEILMRWSRQVGIDDSYILGEILEKEIFRRGIEYCSDDVIVRVAELYLDSNNEEKYKEFREKVVKSIFREFDYYFLSCYRDVTSLLLNLYLIKEKDERVALEALVKDASRVGGLSIGTCSYFAELSDKLELKNEYAIFTRYLESARKSVHS